MSERIPTEDEEIEIDLDSSVVQPSPEPPPPPPVAAEVSTAADALASEGVAPSSFTAQPLDEAQAQELIAALEREANALGGDPAAARLHHEMGLLWEGPLKQPRHAAICFQNAYRIDPTYVPNLRAARRLFSEVGNWPMVAQLLDAEAAVTTEPQAWAALAFEKALLLDERLGRPDEALALLVQCHEKMPEDPGVLVMLETAWAARGDWVRLKEVHEKLAQVIDDPAMQAHHLASAAHLCETRLQNGAEAQALYRRAFALDHADPVLLSAVKRAAERENDDEELLAALRAEAKAAGAAGGPIHYRIARVCERLGRSQEALEALLAGRKVAGADPLILAGLAQRYESAGEWEALAEVLQARSATTSDPNERTALELRLGALFEEKLQREDEAIACYRRVREIAPGNAAAIAALGKLCHRKGDWEGLLETYEAEIDTAEDTRLKAGRMYKAAELLETRLGRDDEAIARYREILELVPGYLPATRALTRIYERTGRYRDLIAMYELELTQTRDRDQIIALLSRVALVCEERLQDLEGAANALRRILDVAQDHLPTIRNLARVCERAGMWEELIRTNDLEASFAGDTKQVISLLHRNAEIYEEHLGSKDQAIEAYQKVLALAPSYLPCLKALGRLYAQTGRWNELVEMYRQEAEVVPSTEQAAGLIFKVGELYEEKLNDLDQAIAAWQEVLTLSPSHFPALRSLSRVYRQQKAWESLVDVLRAEAAGRTDALEKAHALFEVGALWEDELGNVPMAIESYREVLQHVRDHVPAIRALERLYSAQENHRELAALYELEVEMATAPEARISALSKLARLYRERLNEPARAVAAYEEVLAAVPDDLWAIKGLESLKAGDPESRLALRAKLAGRRHDPRFAAALLLAQATDRSRAGIDGAIEDLRTAAALHPDDLRTQAALERELLKAGDRAGLAALWERQLAATADGESKRSLQLRLAELYEQSLGRPDRALAGFRAVLERDPASMVALRGARRLLARTGQHAEVFRLLRVEADACRDPKTAIELLVEAGRLAAEKLDDFEAARAALNEALDRDPLEPRATQLLEELLAARGGASDLAALHLKRAETRIAAGDSVAAADELVGAAKIFAGQQSAANDAIEALDRALTLVPSHAEALQLKGELAWTAGRWAEAAQAWTRRLEHGGEPQELARLHHRLGVIFQQHLNDGSRAVAHLLTSLSTEPKNLEALERLAALQLAAHNWQGAADALRGAIELEKDPQKLAGHLLDYARVAEEGFGDAAAAATHYRRALELAPGNPAVLDKLAGLYERLGNLPELVGLLEKQALDAADAGDKARASSLRMKAAELHVKLGEPVKAVQSYRFAVELQPEAIGPRVALADLLARDGNSVSAAIEEHRNLLKLDPLRMDSYHVLYRLYTGSRQIDRAVCAGHVLSFFRAINEVELASFSEAKGRVPQETSETLGEVDFSTLLYHPAARHPLTEVMRIVGDQVAKVYEPRLDAMGLGRSDRLKSDHAIHKLVKSLASVFGVEKFELYMGKRGAQATTENTDPPSLVVGPDLLRRHTREQRFLLGRAVFDLRNRLALARRLDPQQLADFLGNAIRVVAPGFDRLGRPDPDATKRIRKAMSGRSIRQLEQLVPEINATRTFDLQAWREGTELSADRAGLLLAGDISAVLQLLFREDPSVSGMRIEGTEQLVSALSKRRDFAELLIFVLSDDYAKLRAKLRLAL